MKKTKSKLNTYFDDKITENLIKLITLSNKNIFIAVTWLTNSEIIDSLLEISKTNKVNILIDSSRANYDNKSLESKKANRELKDLQKLFKKKGKLKKRLIKKNVKLYVYHIDSKFNQMHNKFCIIDKRIVITGSFNWSKPAMSNRENIVIIENLKEAKKYLKYFENLISTCDDGHKCTRIRNAKDFKKVFIKKN